MERKNWIKERDNLYFYVLNDITFTLEFAPKEISAGKWENHWLLSGHIDNTTWCSHIIDSLHLETAMQKVEKMVLDVIMRQMKYHLETGNELASLLAKAI